MTPALAGELLQYVSLSAPFLVVAACQALNAILFYAFFHGLAPEEELKPGPGAPASPAPRERLVGQGPAG